MKPLFLLLLIFLSDPASAAERIRKPETLLREGFERVTYSLSSGAPLGIRPHSLAWPVEFQDPAHSIANAMAQFQPFGDPYYHGGCDLRVHAQAEVRSPVRGRLEAGHYSYSTKANGSMEKFWKPWPARGPSLYFELAVVSEDGIRYEFHHVDRATLPASTLAKLNSGSLEVNAGELLGHAIYWPDGEYHHIHYNVIRPDGVRVNPEHVSPLLPDRIPPELIGAYADFGTSSLAFGDGKFTKRPLSFVIATLDRREESVYEHPVAYSRLKFLSGEETIWDFRQTLTREDGSFPDLWDYFVRMFRTPEGRSIRTEGGYGLGQSVIRLNVPASAKGAFSIELIDMAGNETTLRGEILAF